MANEYDNDEPEHTTVVPKVISPAKVSARGQLERDVAEWLARGNSVQYLQTGHSGLIDGIPASLVEDRTRRGKDARALQESLRVSRSRGANRKGAANPVVTPESIS